MMPSHDLEGIMENPVCGLTSNLSLYIAAAVLN